MSEEFDSFAPRSTFSDPIRMGRFAPSDGAFLIRVEVVGKNPLERSPEYFFGLDYLAFSAK